MSEKSEILKNNIKSALIGKSGTQIFSESKPNLIKCMESEK